MSTVVFCQLFGFTAARSPSSWETASGQRERKE